ncbi:dual specificity mitogen-activated protein kinase kinase 5-like [Crassostrea angulata]|uniref:dual specificity mitogen-activated protein kinase kinase 5 n=1 Tax=Magallana gigas TaxID=29159 RepID=UPI0022B17AC9|nr:dual specificity mitogen-activated protein kinase kinase 5-like [Crassostrea angulata]
MNQPPFTIRIRTEQEQDMDWMVQPNAISFHQALEVIAQVLPQTSVTAFEYEDEDDERITVRSDEEMAAMFQAYFETLSEDDIQCGLLPPLIIYPRVGKTPQNRNKFGLKIDTHPSARSSKPVQTVRHIPRQSQRPKTDTTRENPAPSQLPPNDPNIAGAPTILVPQSQTPADFHPQIEPDLKILQMLGGGSGGQVYKALHQPNGTIMAVKIVKLEVDQKTQEQILSELDILNKCQSPVIIGFYKAFFNENRIYICTEFMDGGALDKYAPIPEPVLGRMAVNIIQGLCYMWSLKILHRDIKPSNILVNTQGQVKLCDFGVSTQLERSIAKTYIGSNAYMAPERIKGEDYGTPAEIWSLGITLFELASGKFPYQHNPEKPMGLLSSIINDETPQLSDDHFSPDFVNLVAHCMQQKPEDRLTLEDLLIHPFIQRHNDGNIAVIAAWVHSQLEKISNN